MDHDFLLGDYPEETVEAYEEICDQVEESYPSLLVMLMHRYFDACEEEDFAIAVKRLLDCFELGVPFACALLLHEYHRRGVRDPIIKQAVDKLLSKPLTLGDWMDILGRLLKVETDQDPVFRTAFRKVSHRNNGKLTSFGKRLFNTVVKERNEQAHNTTLDAELALEVLVRHEPTLFEFFSALEPLKRHPTFILLSESIDDDGNRSAKIKPLVGSGRSKSLTIRCDCKLAPEQIYLAHNENLRRVKADEIVPLLPMVVHLAAEAKAGKKRKVFLYQTVTDKPELLMYVSPGKHRLNISCFNDEFWEFVGDFGCTPPQPRKKRSRKRHSWETLEQAARKESQHFVDSMAREKYDRDLFVQRATFTEAARQFLAHPRRRGFALLGNSGAGKTNVLCHLTEQLMAEGHLVATYYAKVFADTTLDQYLTQAFEVPDLKALLANLEAEAAGQEGKQAVFIFDAVNECVPGAENQGGMTPAKLIGHIDRLLVQAGHAHVKVILSCRTYTWEEAQTSLGQAHSLEDWFTTRDLAAGGDDLDAPPAEIDLGGFTPEELGAAYPRYAQKFQLQTTLDELNERRYRLLRHQLRDPFLLKMVSHAHKGQPLPGKIESVSLMARLYEDMVTGGEEVGRAAEHGSLLMALASQMRRQGCDSLELEEVRSLGPEDPLRRLLFGADGEFSPAVRRLIDRGVLRLELQTAWHELRFVYDRFHEFVLARVLQRELRRLNGDGALVGYFERELGRVGSSAVSWGALATALVMMHQQSPRPALFTGLAASEMYGAQGLVVHVLNQLSREDYPAAREVLGHMLGTAARDRRAIKRLRKLDDPNPSAEEVAQREDLHQRLLPATRAKRAAIKVLYDIYRSPFFVDELYDEEDSPLALLWKALADPMDPIREAATCTIYYLWREYPDVAFGMIHRLAREFLGRSILTRYSQSTRKRELEPCAQLSSLLFAETLVSGAELDQLLELRQLWMKIVDKLTLGFSSFAPGTLVKAGNWMVMKGARVISSYVNNLIEYENFWLTVPESGEGYTRDDFRSLVPFLDPDVGGFEAMHDTVVEGARLGDSFNNYLLERVLIAQGVRGYERIADLVHQIYNDADNAHPEYTQMSMLYVIFHTLDKMQTIPEEHFERYAEYMEPWTLSCKGYFFANRNDVANRNRPYKQYTLNWYGALHARLYGDSSAEVPLFDKFMVNAFERQDRDLLLYVVDNIGTLAADFGCWRSALGLFERCLGMFESTDDLEVFNREGEPRMRTILARTLATIRGYFGKEVDRFVMEEFATTSFPDFESFREELVRHEASEALGDLLTHKMGNFFVHGIVHLPAVREHIQEILLQAPDHEDAESWIKRAVTPHLIHYLLNLDV